MCIRDRFNDVVISTEHILYGLSYDEICSELVLNTKNIPEFLELLNKMKSESTINNNFESSNETLDKFGIDLKNQLKMASLTLLLEGMKKSEERFRF